jgi:acyl-CoA synthetase (AMP-forming)/AMP-acid ligase II
VLSEPTRRMVLRSLVNIAETYELQPADRSLLVMPLFHVHGLMAGATAIP